jgi:putative SOS response-associated peptidase YedK
MCARYELDQSEIELPPSALPPLRFTNRRPGQVRPTNVVPIVLAPGGDLVAAPAAWGWVRPWTNALINCRSETAAEKPTFKKALQTQRCLIPASAWIEWTAIPGQKKKQPWRLHRPEPLFCIAGLWEPDSRPDRTADFRFTMMMKAATPELADIHERMPLVLRPLQWAHWLMGTNGAELVNADGIADGYLKTMIKVGVDPESLHSQ